MKTQEAYRVYDIVARLKELESKIHHLDVAISNLRCFEMGNVQIKDSKSTVYSFLINQNDVEPILKVIYSSVNNEKEKLLKELNEINQ